MCIRDRPDVEDVAASRLTGHLSARVDLGADQSQDDRRAALLLSNVTSFVAGTVERLAPFNAA